MATELVRGDFFTASVVLLLHYDEAGAMGIVVNRPTDIEVGRLLAGIDIDTAYSGMLFWGGPVDRNGLRALLRTDSPPANALQIVDSVYQVSIDDALENVPTDTASLRFFGGYAGWGAGQLDREMARGSWHVVPASGEHVFTEDAQSLWESLSPPRAYRAALQHPSTGRNVRELPERPRGTPRQARR